MDFTEYIDLAAERLGGRVLAANDEFFAPKENLLKAAAPVWIEDKYTDVGKWMDGWETRRRRTPGYDWCIVKLGLPGIVHGVVVDTAHFKGNFPEHCEIEACTIDGDPSVAQLEDRGNDVDQLLPKSPLRATRRNPFPLAPSRSGSRICVSKFIRMAAWRAFASTAKSSRIGRRSPVREARSTSPPSSTADGSLFRATCFSARATT